MIIEQLDLALRLGSASILMLLASLLLGQSRRVGFAWRPLAFSMAQNAMILGFSVWLAGRILTVRDDVLTFGVAGADPVPNSPAPDADHGHNEALLRRLNKLIAIALDSGFASLASFNRAFRVIEGCSPA